MSEKEINNLQQASELEKEKVKEKELIASDYGLKFIFITAILMIVADIIHKRPHYYGILLLIAYWTGRSFYEYKVSKKKGKLVSFLICLIILVIDIFLYFFH